MPRRPVVLTILDGWGESETRDGNAVAQAATPVFDALRAAGPVACLVTHGHDAGLPTGQMGNSEVGHTNIGAGRVVAMDLGQIDLAIEDGSFFGNAAIAAFGEALLETGGTAHLLGLVSDGGVHGHVAHIEAACRMLADMGVPVVLHAMTDGRDVAPSSARGFLGGLALPDGATVGTVLGRYYAMDRDQRWERVETAYRAMVSGGG
ncbi:MAG: 2,3-bisphosphoglycerate-independent phosphoglycerate mutase, partial [Shimia sp.]